LARLARCDSSLEAEGLQRVALTQQVPLLDRRRTCFCWKRPRQIECIRSRVSKGQTAAACATSVVGGFPSTPLQAPSESSSAGPDRYESIPSAPACRSHDCRRTRGRKAESNWSASSNAPPRRRAGFYMRCLTLLPLSNDLRFGGGSWLDATASPHRTDGLQHGPMTMPAATHHPKPKALAATSDACI